MQNLKAKSHLKFQGEKKADPVPKQATFQIYRLNADTCYYCGGYQKLDCLKLCRDLHSKDYSCENCQCSCRD